MRNRIITVSLVVLAACSSGGSKEPVGPVTVPVATITTTPGSNTLTVGGTLQLTATPRDASGGALSGRVITWNSTAANIATVSGSGLVTGVAAGSAWIRASSEGKIDSAQVTVTAASLAVTPFLSRPFIGEFVTTNPMDHNTPEEFVDANGIFVSSWGETISAFSSHSGYDFLMPIGTKLLAAGAGTVRLAQSDNFFCPALNRNVDQLSVIIVHTLPSGARFETYYAHLSRLDVTAGQVVTAGTQIGLSGNTGCSTAPHLHFQVDRLTGTNNGSRATVDPYGWSGSGTDPWEALARGAKSVNLWVAGQAPLVQVGADSTNTPINGSQSGPSKKAVVIHTYVFAGANDATNPNNEFIELKIDPTIFTGASYDLTGHYIKNNAGDRYNFPAGTTLTPTTSIRLYTGAGTNSATRLYWGKTAGIYNNLGDCAELFYPNGSYYLIGNAACK